MVLTLQRLKEAFNLKASPRSRKAWTTKEHMALLTEIYNHLPADSSEDWISAKQVFDLNILPDRTASSISMMLHRFRQAGHKLVNRGDNNKHTTRKVNERRTLMAAAGVNIKGPILLKPGDITEVTGYPHGDNTLTRQYPSNGGSFCFSRATKTKHRISRTELNDIKVWIIDNLLKGTFGTYKVRGRGNKKTNNLYQRIGDTAQQKFGHRPGQGTIHKVVDAAAML